MLQNEALQGLARASLPWHPGAPYIYFILQEYLKKNGTSLCARLLRREMNFSYGRELRA